MEPFLAEIKLFAGTFAPRGWAFCQGQMLAISQNQALFSLLGTQYGGDGRVSFALPDLRGRVPMGSGNGPGLTPRVAAQMFGTEKTELAVSNLPPHSHAASGQINATNTDGTTNAPAGNYPAASIYKIDRQNTADILSYGGSKNVEMAADSVSVAVNNTGGGQGFNNFQPTTVMNYIICTEGGTYPSRN